MTASPPSPDAALNLDWGQYLRQREYRRALAAARLGHAPAPVQTALDELYTLQEALRARRLAAAHRALSGYRTAVEGLEPADRTPFAATVPLAPLEAGWQALDATDRQQISDPAVLETQLQPALEEAFTRAEAMNALGVLHALLDHNEQAEAWFMQALAHDPGHYRALTNRGNLALEQGNAVEAERLYREAILLNAEYAGAHHNLGVALRRQNRMHESVRAIRAGQRLSMRHHRQRDDDELRSNPGTQRTVQLVRLALVVLAVLVLLWVVRGGL
ncbi:tetratricopeptide repeat protein [Deinococcus sonorensis]|uniref:Tetratricopeptide repeat protein n=2 Tax=Deinococcus sonorensis TaxID=309891 RepID=A0AAU7UF06_9DEIO